ncbi:S16 family serine protease [Mycoplasma seminis]|uniref:endopeptidase La n=1 Tax=Mycoplasma seminis TaxID=512749 RepID=A0ABY9HBN7_9MOLU|nr:S16 family serine protease [Mycoplasma seminis]WLP85768.1 S16 family serine protease [Mycoplasma seminis]
MKIIKTQKFLFKGGDFDYTLIKQPNPNDEFSFEIYDNNIFLYSLKAKVISYSLNNYIYTTKFHGLDRITIDNNLDFSNLIKKINNLLKGLKYKFKFPKNLLDSSEYINMIESINNEYNLFDKNSYYVNLVNKDLYSQLKYLQDKLDKYLSKQNCNEFKNIPDNILQRYKETKVQILIQKALNNQMDDRLKDINIRNEMLINLPWRKITNELIDCDITAKDLASTYSAIYNHFKNYIGTLNIATKHRQKDNKLYNCASIVVDTYAFREAESKAIEAPLYILNGAPGTGKTYFAEKLARKIGRKFVKISLGGATQIGYFRGTSNTPSIIIQKLLEAGVSNPVILLDEIDKIHPNMYAELLDVLDKKQNDHFHDNYLNVDYDLSKIIFIGTSNYIGNLPSEIISRVKLLQIHPYTLAEKIQIGKDIADEFQAQYDITKSNYIEFEDNALKTIITKIALEDGVRKLKQEIESLIFYAIANKITLISNDIIHKYYSKQLEELEYHQKLYKSKEKLPGMVNGLAISPIPLFNGIHNITCIHSIVKADTPHVEFLSEVSDTTLNSAKIALRYAISNKDRFGINSETDNLLFTLSFDQIYIKNDGDSAGIAFTTAIISDLLNKAVPSNWAITGSIDLKGNAQVVGGIKEKIEGAFNDHITNFIIPYENERDIKNIDPEIRKQIKIHTVKNYNEVFKLLFK